MTIINSIDLFNVIAKANDENLSYTQSANELFNISQVSIFDLVEQGYSEEEISDFLISNLDASNDGDGISSNLVESLKSFISNIINLSTSNNEGSSSDETVSDWKLEDTGNLFKDGVTKEDFLTEFDNLLENATDDASYSEYLNAIKENGAENFFNTIDTNGDGTLSQSELDSFISGDGNSESISLSDMTKVLPTFGENSQHQDVAEVADTPKTSSTNSSSGSGGGSYSGGGSQTTSTPKSLDNMSLAELQSEEKARATALTDAETSLKDVYTGKDSKVASAQEAMNSQKSAYDEAVQNDEKISKSLKQKKSKNDEDIAQNEQAISDKQSAIVDKQSEINAKENEISACESAITSLQSSLSKLQGQLSSVSSDDEDASTKKAEINALIGSVNQQIKEQETKKQDAEKQKEQLDSDYERLNRDLGKLEETKTTLQSTRDDIEAQIAETGSASTQAALKSYQDSRTSFEATKAARITEAKTALDTAQTDYKAVADKLTEKQNKQIASQNRYNDGELFSEDTEIAWEYMKDPETGMTYGVIKPANANPDDELPVLVLCHGSGEGGTSDAALIRYYNQMTSQGFNGYIILPQVGSGGVGSWGTKAGENITSVLDTFSETHNIDTDHIAIAGYSAGAHGNALINTANGIDSSKYTIVSAGIIASQPTDDEVNGLRNQGIEVYGFTGSSDGYGMTTANKVSDTTVYQGVSHGQGIIATLSDTGFYEKLFGEYYKY